MYALSQPKIGPPRVQFAIRWKPDSKMPTSGRRLSGFGATLEIEEGSVAALSEANLTGMSFDDRSFRTG